jgi:hypothetical protein
LDVGQGEAKLSARAIADTTKQSTMAAMRDEYPRISSIPAPFLLPKPSLLRILSMMLFEDGRLELPVF